MLPTIDADHLSSGAGRLLGEASERRGSAQEERVAKAANWTSPLDVNRSFTKAKVVGLDRVRFEVAGGDFRLIVAFDFMRQIAFIKFIGTHADYDRVDASTISRF